MGNWAQQKEKYHCRLWQPIPIHPPGLRQCSLSRAQIYECFFHHTSSTHRRGLRSFFTVVSQVVQNLASAFLCFVSFLFLSGLLCVPWSVHCHQSVGGYRIIPFPACLSLLGIYLSLGVSQPGPFTQAVEKLRTAHPSRFSFRPLCWTLSPVPITSWLSHHSLR